ncbi:MAG TPA: hypothetical protein VLH77_04130 [Gammaproteobacteria bacterium]|nr:hypothetical protein [Gammaproteobacteria bacterium]
MTAKIKAIVSILFIVFSPLALASYDETSTFSLIAYDDWLRPSKPLPAGWSYLIKSSPNLQADGYLGVSFIKCSEQQGQKSCTVAIAHRGTTLAIFDLYEDLLVFLEKTPDYFDNALQFVSEVRSYVQNHFSEKNPLILNTGHSLGALLAELIQAADSSFRMYTSAYDTPGSKTMIDQLVGRHLLPRTAFENMKRHTSYYFTTVNAINTCNPQLGPLIDAPLYEINSAHEDFSNAPINQMSPPGLTYYFWNYSLAAHAISHFYHPKGLFMVQANWPAGLRTGYHVYLSPIRYGQYWDDYMNYAWKNSRVLKFKFSGDFEAYRAQFLEELKEKMGFQKNKNLLNESIDKQLYYAILGNDTFEARKLLNLQAKVNTPHGAYRYPLIQIAIILGHPDMVELLPNTAPIQT